MAANTAWESQGNPKIVLLEACDAADKARQAQNNPKTMPLET